ncbi:hypothetical protein BBJ28_00004681 [Nothophytophthora sp. Chile5]|nr:hypothetical protein BBJ28_00004681 [Nothophytophthora sp. Chile5]
MLLLRRCSSPLVAARSRIGGTGVAPLWPAIAQWQLSALSHAFSSSSTTTSAAVRAPSRSTPTALLFTRTSLSPATSSSLRLPPGLSPLPTMQLRCYSPGRNPWQNGNDWKTMAKTGALVVLGTGALVASTSVAFGLIIAGAAGYGVYSLYQRFFGPYRSGFGSSSDPFGGVSSNIDALNDMFGRSASRRQNVDARSPRRGRSAVQDDLDSLVQGMPLVVRGLVKTIFSFVGRAMKSSMERAGELRRRTNEYLQANKRVREQMGDDVSVGGPQQWMESSKWIGTGDWMLPDRILIA